MFSLAAFKYRSVFTTEGGPIDRVTAMAMPVLGKAYHQANAFLKAGLVPVARHAIYGEANGTGSSEDPQVAAHMAISEALERWAFHATSSGADGGKYGFDCDYSSNGMAAFPGLFKSMARKKAFHEALERFALIGWWDGRLEATQEHGPFPGVSLVRIHHGVGPGEVVVLYRRAPSGITSYGHAAGSSVLTAASRAAIELVRNEFVITGYRARGALVEPSSFAERRCLHYASHEGFAEFLARVDQKAVRPAPSWRVVFDGEIVGPWSKYATVWRTCVEPPTDDFLNPNKMFFFW
jgi:hypothetical protein